MPQPTGNRNDGRKTGNLVTATFAPPKVMSHMPKVPTASVIGPLSVGRLPYSAEVTGSKHTGGNTKSW